MANDNNLSPNRKVVFWLITILLVIGSVEGISWLGVWFLEKKFDVVYQPLLPTDLSNRHRKALVKFIDDAYDLTTFSAKLGWTVKPNADARKGRYVTNSKQIRADKEYPLTKPENKTRIATFGDSYTFGMEVKNHETWQKQLVAQLTNIEVLNFGIAGHGPDQAYLRYLDEGIPYNPDIVVLGFMSENINRIVNVYRPYYVRSTGLPLTKPRFIKEGTTLKLIPNPHQKLVDYQNLLDQTESVLTEIGRHDFFYQTRYARQSVDIFRTVRLIKMVSHNLFKQRIYDKRGAYNTQSEAFQLLITLLGQFYQDISENGSKFLLVIYPELLDVIREKGKKPKRYQPLIDWLDNNGYPYVDLMDSILLYDSEALEVKNFFVKNGGHYSPVGNNYAARQILAYLQKWYLK
jgi:hypothetical protein